VIHAGPVAPDGTALTTTDCEHLVWTPPPCGATNCQVGAVICGAPGGWPAPSGDVWSGTWPGPDGTGPRSCCCPPEWSTDAGPA